MATLVLTEADLSTITNALTGVASACRRDAEAAPDNAAGVYLRGAAMESATQYEALAMKIAEADSIKVECG
jgi:hypothetical protein